MPVTTGQYTIHTYKGAVVSPNFDWEQPDGAGRMNIYTMTEGSFEEEGVWDLEELSDGTFTLWCRDAIAVAVVTDVLNDFRSLYTFVDTKAPCAEPLTIKPQKSYGEHVYTIECEEAGYMWIASEPNEDERGLIGIGELKKTSQHRPAVLFKIKPY